MKIVVDVCLSREVSEALVSDEDAVVHWLSIGADTAKDSEIMRWCTENDPVLITADQDFGAILSSTKQKGPNVIILRTVDHLPARVIPLIHEALARFRQELMDGCLLAVDERAARIRRLPIP